MSHFAKIKYDGSVIKVIAAEPSTIHNGIMGNPHEYVQTSYNHKFRNKFAAVGDTYDRALDMFLSPKPYPSWILETYIENDIPRAVWKAPIDKPDDNTEFIWNETIQNWEKV